MRLFGTELNETESKVASKLAATGQITKLAVVVDEGPGELVATDYTLVVNGQFAPLHPFGPFHCGITQLGTMCEAEGCVKVNMGDTLSLAVRIISNQGAPFTIHPARWTARFVETDAACPLTEQ